MNLDVSDNIYTSIYDIIHVSERKNSWEGKECANQMAKNTLRKKQVSLELGQRIQSQKGKVQFKTMVTQPFTSKPHL